MGGVSFLLQIYCSVRKYTPLTELQTRTHRNNNKTWVSECARLTPRCGGLVSCFDWLLLDACCFEHLNGGVGRDYLKKTGEDVNEIKVGYALENWSA